MPDLRPILFVNGLLLAILSVAMLVPALVDATLRNPEWETFLGTSAFTLFVGGALTLTNRSAGSRLNVRQAFLLVTSAWVLIALFGALPFIFSPIAMSFTDAFFEAMSGITTTGSTVIVGLDSVPEGLLMWRAILQWLGGVGIVVIAIAIMPMLRVGGMQLLSLESSDTSEKALPRAASIAFGIGGIYLLLTLACAVFYWLFGMAGFDAVAHAMTTIATGGFSTTDRSFAAFDHAGVQWTGVVFMLLGSLPFVLYLRAVRGDLMALLEDSQVRWFFGAVSLFVLIMIAWLVLEQGFAVGWSVRHAAFNIVSILTGTGYVASDFGLWGGFALTIFFL
ncbi:MAG: potassium transporter TrkG, partial [Alphaproteobacteria bacterium]